MQAPALLLHMAFAQVSRTTRPGDVETCGFNRRSLYGSAAWEPNALKDPQVPVGPGSLQLDTSLADQILHYFQTSTANMEAAVQSLRSGLRHRTLVGPVGRYGSLFRIVGGADVNISGVTCARRVVQGQQLLFSESTRWHTWHTCTFGHGCPSFGSHNMTLAPICDGMLWVMSPFVALPVIC